MSIIVNTEAPFGQYDKFINSFQKIKSKVLKKLYTVSLQFVGFEPTGFIV
jgi:hypothetical protein